MNLNIIIAIILFFSGLSKVKGEEGLTFTYYNKTCPQVENIVSDALKSVSLQDPHIPAALLRLLFHDCRVGGCDASILLDVKNKKYSEMDSSNNFGVKNREIIDEIKSRVDAACPGQVSCSDILVLAAREAVAMSGGPIISVPLGRRDTPIARTLYEADTTLPDSNQSGGGAIDNIRELGMTTEEAIALLGAHTLGNTHCSSVTDRVASPPGNETKFLKVLGKICSGEATTTLVTMDPTPRVFDNKIFINSMNGYGVILVDQSLRDSRQTRRYVQKFADDEAAFFAAFSSGFVKLSSFGVLTGKKGIVRKQCNKLFD